LFYSGTLKEEAIHELPLQKGDKNMQMSKETQKILIIGLIAIVALNLLDKEFNGKNGGIAANQPTQVIPQVVPQPAAPPPPNPEEEFKKQLADKVNVDLGNTPVLGDRNAKIMIIVFSDYQCPFSKRGAETTMALVQKYGRNISYVYKNLPLGFHDQAMPSAKAATAAGKQGKYYEFHDKLFENQDKLGEPLYTQIAKDLGLDINKFNTDRNSPEVEALVKADAAQAGTLGFNGTPGFTLNGVKILGAYPIDHFEKIISALGLG
jgi:protein-disulfide isomerase